jgi:putative NIF3 family GTP cyclohydrolase 1 type 2
MPNTMSRRGLLASAAVIPFVRAQAETPITAVQVVERIKKKLAEEGTQWGTSSFDKFHLGDPNIAVTGIAVTFEPTFGVLKRALAAKKNFVVSHESTFWDGFDPVEVMLHDPLCQAKIRFAEQNRMAVWRIHDHWHRKRPDPVFTGFARKVEWMSYYNVDTRPRHYEIPEASLEEVARHLQSKLGTRNVVVVGDPKLRVKTVGDCIHVLSSVLPALHACDVALVGETPEFDTFEYMRDALALGMRKAVIMISHEALEEWGMEAFAGWIKPAVPELSVEWISTGDPFQVPL